LDFPPDAFKVRTGEISACTVEWENYSLKLKLGPEGRVEQFPFMLKGGIAQVSFDYLSQNEIREMQLTFPAGEDPWKLEFLDGFSFQDYKDSFPFLVRASCGDAWYFIYLVRGVSEIIETWYDEAGKALGAYRFSLTEIGYDLKIRTMEDFSNSSGLTEYFYDSRGLLTDCFGAAGFYRVLFFREDLPRYWEREGNNFSLQWDENDLLVRLRGEPENEPFVDCRYEYNLDENGNWVERQEIKMIRNFGLLIPSQGSTFRRVLEYEE
jgi:hypothetical protein